MAEKEIIHFLCLFFISTASCLISNAKDSIVLQETDKKSDASKFFIAYSPSYVTFLPNAGAIASDEISDVISLALGLSSTKELGWAGLLAGDVFRRPKANVLITVDGISEDDKFDVVAKAASYPVTESEGATRLAGVLSTSSVTQENLPSRVTTMFGGKSLTVSVSGSELLAAAGHAKGTNSHTLFWNQAEDKFQQVNEDVHGFADWSSAKGEIVKRLEKADFGEGVKFASSSKEFTVAFPVKGKCHLSTWTRSFMFNKVTQKTVSSSKRQTRQKSSFHLTTNKTMCLQLHLSKSDASKFFIAYSPSYVTFLPNAGAIASDEISDVISLALGLSSTKELGWAGLLAGDVFRRPKANVLITVDGISEDDKFDVVAKAASYPVTEVGEHSEH
ncbi:uncharacterized protein [Montipora capricornis]|uniref:uncharacterized protein n=1 Tax=Montipora capricornis TaxID=246305 RepID=UPI0035F155E2